MREVVGWSPDLARGGSDDRYAQMRTEHKEWCIHSGYKTHGQSQPKPETEGTSGTANFEKKEEDVTIHI